ncbi:hypothetical protein L2E82_51933 [Cichorium intybus]|nr:hypothetical protein L2E82_51933 [Cichorium intybus]
MWSGPEAEAEAREAKDRSRHGEDERDCSLLGRGQIEEDERDRRKIVEVLLNLHPAQYQSSLPATVRTLNSSNKFASYEVVGYLVEELRDENNYKSLYLDLEDANIFIGSLIFMEELTLKVKAAVEKQRDR